MNSSRSTLVDESDAIPLGHGPLPATDAELASRLRTAIAAEWPEPAAGWDSIPGWTAAFSARPDLASIELDLTGYAVPVGGQGGDADVAEPRSAAIGHVQPALIASARVLASPMDVAGVPLDLLLDASDLPVEWVTDAEGELWIRLDEARAGDLRAHFRLCVPVDEARAGLRAALTAELAAARFGLSSFDVDLRARRGTELSGWVQARLRKGILSAKARARAEVRIDPVTMSATVTRLSVRSANPVLGLALLAVRSKIRAYEGRSFDLNESMPAGVRLVGLTVDTAGSELVVSGRFG